MDDNLSVDGSHYGADSTDDEFTKPDEYDVWEESGAKQAFGPLEGTRCFLKSYHDGMDCEEHYHGGQRGGYFNGGIDASGYLSVWLYRNDDSHVCCVNVNYSVWHWTFSDEDVEQQYYVEVTPEALVEDDALMQVSDKILTYIELEKRLGKDVANLTESYL